MAISYSSEGYKVTPQFANLGALQGLQPLDVTRKATFEPRPLAPIEVYSSRPELVAQGLAQGIQSAVSGVTEGIKAHYSEKKELAKEERKYEKELLLEKAKQKTKNESYIDELILKTTAEHGGEADLPERIAGIKVAAERLQFVNPSGNVAETKTEKTNKSLKLDPLDTTKPLSEQGMRVDAQGRAITNALLLPDEVVSTANQPLQGYSYQREMQAKGAREDGTTTQPAVVTQPSSNYDTINIPEPLSIPTQPVPVAPQVPASPPVVIQPAQPAGQPTQELTNIQPVTAQGGVVPAPAEFNRPEQPKDPKLPRDLRSYVYMPNESSNAYQTAAELTTPYRKVSVQENPRTKELILIQEDTSKDVLDLQVKAQQMGISAEDLALRKNQLALDREKQDMASVESNRKILKEDKSYRESIKNSINKQSTKLELIDSAITKINQNPDLVGIYSQYLRGKEPLGGFNYQNIAAIAKGAGYSGPMEKIQKIIDIEEDLKSIEANLGWEELAEMKKLSTTGSAGTGGLTEGERQSLEKTQGSIAIIKSDSELKKTLYNLRNGTVKAISNASNQVQSIDPTFKREFYEPLIMSPDEEKRISYLYTNLEKATEAQKTQRNYLDGLYELKRLEKKKKDIDNFNKEIGTLVKPK